MVSWDHCARGLRGVALLVLRGSVAALILIGGQSNHLLVEPSAVTLLLSAISVGLGLGIWTVLCAVAAIAGGVLLLATGQLPEFGSGVVTLFLCSVVAILGPGAYSLDCILFGRRKIVLDTGRSEKDKAAS